MEELRSSASCLAGLLQHPCQPVEERGHAASSPALMPALWSSFGSSFGSSFDSSFGSSFGSGIAAQAKLEPKLEPMLDQSAGIRAADEAGLAPRRAGKDAARRRWRRRRLFVEELTTRLIGRNTKLPHGTQLS